MSSLPLQALSLNLPLRVRSVGSALPEKAYTHEDLLRFHPEYTSRPQEKLQSLARKTQSRFGFSKRHMVAPPFQHHNQDAVATSETLALSASENALSKVRDKNIEVLVHGTTTTSRYTGSQAPAILAKLASNAAAIEMKAGCSTSLAALHTAFGFLSMGYRNAMVSCAETLSKTISVEQLETLFLLADGGASVWLERDSIAPDFIVKRALYHTDGTYIDTYTTPGKLPPNQQDLQAHKYTMQGDGQELRAQAERRYQEMLDTLFPEGRGLENITWVVPHQINRALIDALLDRNRINANVQWDAERVGNLGGTSVLYSLTQLLASKQLKHGDEILLMSVGGGLSFAMQHWKWVGNNEH